jgi:membrane protease YdiL (CAAX protease family)
MMQPERDLPYYNGRPVEISALGWLSVLLAVAVGFVLLTRLPFVGLPLNLVPPVAFAGLPLLALAAVTGGQQSALFGRFGFKELGLVLGFGILTLAGSLAIGLVLAQFISMTPNPSFEALGHFGAVDLAAFAVRTFIQLVGEEILTILPLLAVLWFCVRKLNLSRRLGLIIAVIVSTLVFAALHLPTYNWNVIQCLGGIGTARLILTAAYLVTRNLWVSAGAHIVNDWTEFLLPSLLGGLAGHGPTDAGG